MNLERQEPLEISLDNSESIASFYFQLGTTVKIESRVVNSLPELFGSIGGLREFFSTLTLLLIGGF